MTSESGSEEYLRSMGLSPLGWDAGKGLGPDDLVNYLFLFQSEPRSVAEEGESTVEAGRDS